MSDRHWRTAIMEMSAEDGRQAAVDLLSEVMGDDDQTIEHWRVSLGIPPQAAQLLAMLLARPGRMVRKEAILIALDSRGSEALARSLLHVLLTHIRTAMRRDGLDGRLVRSHHGTGFSIDGQIAADLKRRFPCPDKTL